ncbi:MAG: zinc-ribbon domain-containing protein [Myxococcales bacterium]
MVVQCPNCQSRFRVADEKVSDRGVRVRCSACKTVFAVRRSADANAPASEKKRTAEPAKAAGLPTRTSTSAKIVPNRPGGVPSQEQSSGANRLEADDLFGMSELTGESAPPRAPLPASQTNDSIVLGRLSTPFATGFPTSSFPSAPAPAKIPEPEPPLPVPEPDPTPEPPAPKKVEEPDPFADLSLTAPGMAQAAATAAAIRDTGPTITKTPRRIEQPKAPSPIAVRKAPEEAPTSPRRDLVASALTGIVIAALVLAVLRIPSISEGIVPAWLSLAAASDLVPTRIRSGLYDTSTGKPVFFVRGKVENHGKTVRGPVRIVAELVGRSGVDARAEAVAGIEPSAEDVYALRSGGDADKLAKALAGTEGDRRIQPGSSAPFFAIIADPPADLARHKLSVRVEPLETPGAPRSAEGPR